MLKLFVYSRLTLLWRVSITVKMVRDYGGYKFIVDELNFQNAKSNVL